MINIKRWAKEQLTKIKPSEHAIMGAANSLIATSALLFIFFAISVSGHGNDPWVMLFFATIAVIVVLSALLGVWLVEKLDSVPKRLKLALLIASPLLMFSLGFEGVYVLVAILLVGLLGASLNVLTKGNIRAIPLPKKIALVISVVISVGGLIASTLAYIPVGFESKPSINAAALNARDISNIAAPSPASTGTYEVSTLTYGSAEDKHRREFSDKVSIRTAPVNGVAFLDNWSGFGAWYRERYWGFDDKALPLNAYVWYPQGEGPFPLVLMVHGNHSMQDYSDNGYAYLGELLASRGFIFASVDQNFINASWSDVFGGLEKENDARAWLLLEHLQLWHEWQLDPSSPFYAMVDTQNIALIGHSRGGEAVAHAALLNSMPAFYDDASVPFNFGFNIKSVLAVAPVDGQYKPGDSLTPLKDLNYFVMHGAQDGDVTSYAGAKQYQRVKLSAGSDYVKAGLYIAGANHGQFNSGWGDNDTGGFINTGFLNNKPLLPEAQQQEIAKVYISAFLEATLKGKREYLPLFMDHRRGQDWLPNTVMLNQFEHASFYPIVNFNDDFNVLTTSVNNGTISTKNLTIWREQEVSTKWGLKGTRAAVLGWHNSDESSGESSHESSGESSGESSDNSAGDSASNNADKPNDTGIAATNTENTSTQDIDELTPEASFEISLQPGASLNSVLAANNGMFVFSMAESSEKTNPKASGKWVNNNTNNAERNNSANDNEQETSDAQKPAASPEDETPQPINFSIVFEDAMGHSVDFPLSQFSALQRKIETQIWKSAFIFNSRESELVFQTFSYPLTQISQHNPDFDINNLSRIRFVFNKSSKGAVVLESIGFSHM